MEKEIWSPVVSYEGIYEVSNLGNVKHLEYKRKNTLTGGYSIMKERILKPVKHKNGYVVLDLHKNRFHKIILLHRIVAVTFIPNTKNRPQINHLDGNKENNRVDNLEWCTPRENVLHAVKNGLSKSKLLPYDIILIRQQLCNNEKQTEIAKRFNVSKYVIQDIKRNRNWNHVG